MKCKNITESFSHAIDGILYTIRNERNMKIHCTAAILVIILSVLFKLSNVEFAMIFLSIGLVLVSEVVNTAVENIVDMSVKGYNEYAKIAKDVAAGGALLAALTAVAVGISIFGWRILEWIKLI